MTPNPNAAEPALSLDEVKEILNEATAPRVTEDSIKGKIVSATYLHEGVLTICVIRMQNGFYVTGESAPASPANFNSEIGKRYAYDNAFRKIWQLEGYLLRSQLAAAK